MCETQAGPGVLGDDDVAMHLVQRIRAASHP